MYVWNRTEIFEYDLKQAVGCNHRQVGPLQGDQQPGIRAHDIDISPDGCNLYIDDRGNSQGLPV